MTKDNLKTLKDIEEELSKYKDEMEDKENLTYRAMVIREELSLLKRIKAEDIKTAKHWKKKRDKCVIHGLLWSFYEGMMEEAMRRSDLTEEDLE